LKLLFRRLDAGEMERPPTQRDQFNNDDVSLSEALVRESLQNSLDAAAPPARRVQVKFSFVEPPESDLPHLDHFLSKTELVKHLELCEMMPEGVDLTKPRLLLIEDFGTRGLEGSCTAWDEGPFCDFWRRMGLSHKKGGALGRWGLGKLVFSSASSVRSFFGLTIRRDDREHTYVMGQAVLTTHQDGTTRFDSHGFFALVGPDGIQVPETSATQVAAFRRVCHLSRSNEVGLSIVIPYVHQNITSREIVQAVLRNYFFPILTGKLAVNVDDAEISSLSFQELATKFGDARFSDGKLAEFICSMQRREDGVPPSNVLERSWLQHGVQAGLNDVEKLREDFAGGRLVCVRAPFLLKRKDGTEYETYFDLYLQRCESDRTDTLYVRDTIVLPAEARYFQGRRVYAALVAREPALCAFLGDAENPAHTSWSASAEKVTQNWRNPATRLKEIRTSLQQLHNVLVSAIDTIDPNALVNFFSTETKSGGVRGPKPKGPITKRPKIPVTPASPRLFRVNRLPGGFAIRSTSALTADALPLTLRVRAAYDVLRGNPFKKHDALDFDFTKGKLSITSRGASLFAENPNTLTVDVAEQDFEVQVTGFDINRDIIIDPSRSS
jgi:hypothetical protein